MTLKFALRDTGGEEEAFLSLAGEGGEDSDGFTISRLGGGDKEGGTQGDKDFVSQLGGAVLTLENPRPTGQEWVDVAA